MNNPHHNARTCVYSREQIVLRHRAGETAAAIAAAFGISQRTVHKWLRRFREEGIAGLTNRSSQPARNPNAYLLGWKALIVKLRHYHMTALDLPRSSISHALKRFGLNRLNRLTPPEPVRRYERKRPGDLIHLDIKKLGRFNKPGHRVTGWQRRKRSAEIEFIGAQPVSHTSSS